MTSDNGTSAGHDLTELSDEQVHAALGDEESAHLEPVEVSDEVDEAASADDESTEGAAEAAADDAEAEPAAADDDPVATLRAELLAAPGEWYVVHSYAGYENKVKTNLETRTQTLDVEDYIFQIEVPTEEVTEIKNGQRKQVQRKVLPGYILVRMDLNDASWSAVRNTPGVTGFVGATSRPSPLTVDEVLKFLAAAGREGSPGEGRQGRVRRDGGPARRPGRRGRLRGRRVGHGHGRPVRHAAGDDLRGQRRRAEAEGPGVDLRPGDPGRAVVHPGLQDLTAARSAAVPTSTAGTRGT